MYAEIYWLTTAEGGRTNPILPSRAPFNQLSYWANTQTKGLSAWSVGVFFENGDLVQLGKSGKYEIKFLMPDGEAQWKSGDVIHICEGKKMVGRGVIL